MPVKHRFGASLEETRDLGLVPIRLSVTLRDPAGPIYLPAVTAPGPTSHVMIAVAWR